MPIAKEGWPFIGAAALFAVIGWAWLPVWLAVVLTANLLFCLNFFRDPARTPPADPAAIVSPADGRVVAIEPHEDGFLGEPGRRISVFMSVVDVHVNRAPVTGAVASVAHRPGRFLNAMKAAASEHNEQTRITITSERGKLVVTQIAGLVARRIVCDLAPNDRIVRGDRIGMIRFGSRLDVVVPARCVIRVQMGAKVVAGESVLADWSA